MMKHRRTWQEHRVWLGIVTVLIIGHPVTNRSLDTLLQAAAFNWWYVAILAILILAGMVVTLTIMLVRTRHQIAPKPGPLAETPVPPAPVQMPTPIEAQAPSETPAPEGTVPSEAIISAEAIAVAEAPVLVPEEPIVEVPASTEEPISAEAQAQGEAPPPPSVEIPFRTVTGPLVPQFLEAITVNGKSRRFPLNRASLSIGRASDNDIVIGDEFPNASSMADHHARISRRESWAVIEAADPDAPIYVNDQRTGRNILRNGWRVTLGEVDFAFRTAGLGTAPLAEPEAEQLISPGDRAPRLRTPSDLGPLADGALLDNHYIVLEGRTETPMVNVYVVESLEPVLRCTKCGYDANGPRQRSCRNCGASLGGTIPYFPHYRVKESVDEQAFQAERHLIGLSHPHALLPREAFTETPYGSVARHYVVGPEVPPQLAATIRAPQEMPTVLEWMQQLAQGMAYLHDNGVALGPIDLWRVALENQQARWADFTPCELVEEAERPYRFGREVRALAEMTYYLITGQRKYDESIRLSPPGVAMMFDRILGGLEAPTASQLAAALQTGLVEVRRPSSLDVRVGRLSDVGQVRQLNEDSLLTIEIGRVGRSISEPLGLYAICDGMGGHSAGDVASGLATQTLARKALAEMMSDGIASDTQPNWEGWLKSAIQEANQTIFGRRRASGNNMGTTCVAALVHGDEAVIGNAGDSRCYLINDHGILQLTSDHSLVQRLIQLKQLSPEEARTHPQRNVIYKNLGDKSTVEPDVITQPIAAGDRLLLCSDGLSNMVEDERLRQIVMLANSPQEACRQLIQEANRAGGEDNITVILVQLEALD
jgi:serine/threonine protein phosphatase PrpC